MDSQLDKRISILESRLEIFELEGRYARLFDAHDGESWSALFTEDGVYRSRDPEKTYVKGRRALENFCTNAEFEGIHLFHLPQLTVRGSSATARIHLEYRGFWPREECAPSVDMVGYYDVAYKRVNGTWLISERVTTTFSHRHSSAAGYAAGSGLTDPV